MELGAFVSGPGQTVEKGRLNVVVETKGKMKPVRMSWYPCLSLTSYNSSEDGGLLKMLMSSPLPPLEMKTHVVQD